MSIEAKNSATLGVMSEAAGGESRRRRGTDLSRPPQSSTLLFLLSVGAEGVEDLAAAALSQGETSESKGECSQSEAESRDLGGQQVCLAEEGQKGSAEVLDFIWTQAALV